MHYKLYVTGKIPFIFYDTKKAKQSLETFRGLYSLFILFNANYVSCIWFSVTEWSITESLWQQWTFMNTSLNKVHTFYLFALRIDFCPPFFRVERENCGHSAWSGKLICSCTTKTMRWKNLFWLFPSPSNCSCDNYWQMYFQNPLSNELWTVV